MTFRQFTAFAAVAKHMNITKAAQALGMSQPSLSKHLKTLEYDYKIKLFPRYAKGIRLTDEGHEFRANIEPIPGAVRKVKSALSERCSRKAIRPIKNRWDLRAVVQDSSVFARGLQGKSASSRGYYPLEFECRHP